MRKGIDTAVTQTPLLGYFVSHAKRRPFDPVFFRRKPPYPLRRNVADSTFLQGLCLPPEYLTATLDTICTDFIVLPARLVRESKQNVVKLPHDHHYQRQFLEASRKIEQLRLPEKSPNLQMTASRFSYETGSKIEALAHF